MKKILLLVVFICFASVGFCDEIQNAKSAKTDEETNLSTQARVFYLDNNLKKSFDIISSIPEDERTAQDWLLLGNVLQDQDKTPEAVFMLNRAILVDKKFYKAYYNLANIYLQEEKPNLAIANYKNAIKYKSEFAYAYYNLGCAYIHIGELKKAKSAFLNAVNYNKNEPDIYYNLAYIYKKLGKEKNAKIYFDFYKKCLEIKSSV
jgi:tetratricopeptide (TPR) repeat protein